MTTHSITFNFDRLGDENARALLAFAEILGNEEISYSCIESLGYISDALFDKSAEIRRVIVEEFGRDKEISLLATRFREVASILEGSKA